MRELPGVFTTDGVNLRNEVVPLHVLVDATETHVRDCIDAGAPIGILSNVGHDLCRSLGWAISTGVFIAKDMSRQLGVMLIPETDEETQRITQVRRDFILRHHYEGVKPYAEELDARIPEAVREGASWLRTEAASLTREGLAAELYPEFFSAGAGLVDKDGLVDYGALLARTTVLSPGVFHEPKRDVVLFAHRYFRRSLSHMNAVNVDALQTFHNVATQGGGVRGRLRLDPDIVGHPASARSNIEFEYWRGPRFDDDVAAIPSGVAEHKLSGTARELSGIDKVQVWWKDPEQRAGDEGRTGEIRTLEVEELVENPTAGLGRDRFGCRYAHAEYDLAAKWISHFDGAIRAYEADPYLERLDTAIDRAGKHALYTKLFRLDGAVPIADWKRLLCDWFRGNELIPEYLGEQPDSKARNVRPPQKEEAPQSQLPRLCALIDFRRASPDDPALSQPAMRISGGFEIGGVQMAAVEVGPEPLAGALRTWIEDPDVATFEVEEQATNLAAIRLGEVSRAANWEQVCTRLTPALEGSSGELAIAFEWEAQGMTTSLSFLGESRRVAELLAAVREVVRPDESAETWIEGVRDALVGCAPDLTAPVDWPKAALETGRLQYPRPPSVKVVVRPPDEAFDRIKTHIDASAGRAIRPRRSSPRLDRGAPPRRDRG